MARPFDSPSPGSDASTPIDLSQGSWQSTVDLIELARQGDSGALELLYQRYLPRLERWARGRLPSHVRRLMDTNDLVQETMAATIGHLPRFERRTPGSFAAYLRQGIRNRISDLMRRKENQLLTDGTVGGVADQRPTPFEELIGREMSARYLLALSRLSPDDQDLVFAKIELQLPWGEVADLLGRPSADAARVATARAILRLSKAMADD